MIDVPPLCVSVMPSPSTIPPDDAARFAADIVSRYPQTPYMTDADRARLTDNLSRFLSRCVLVAPPSPAPPADQDDTTTS